MCIYMFVYGWATIADSVLTLNQHMYGVACFRGDYHHMLRWQSWAAISHNGINNNIIGVVCYSFYQSYSDIPSYSAEHVYGLVQCYSLYVLFERWFSSDTFMYGYMSLCQWCSSGFLCFMSYVLCFICQRLRSYLLKLFQAINMST